MQMSKRPGNQESPNLQLAAIRKPARWKTRMLAFILKHGRNRLTLRTRRIFNRILDLSETPGNTVLLAAVCGGRLAGIACASPGADGLCFVVVHTGFRGRHLGRTLLRKLCAGCGKLTCRVAADNPASLRMCLAAGLRPAMHITGPTGKPTVEFTAPASVTKFHQTSG